MHRRPLGILVLLVLIAAPGALRPPLAAGASTRNVVISHTVIATYSVAHESGCVTTSVFVSADIRSGAIPSAPDASPSGAQVALTRADTCEKRTILTASGAVAFDGGELDVNGNPRSARLRVVIPATDPVSGTVLQIEVDLAWQGVGPVARGSGSPGPPQANAPRVRTRYREATLTGTVTDGTTAFAPGPAAVASMTTAISRPDGADSRRSGADKPVVAGLGAASLSLDGAAFSGPLGDPACPGGDAVAQKE